MKTRLLLPVPHDLSVLRAPQIVSTAVEDRPLGIGIKPNGIRLNREDYKTYVKMRNNLLDGPIGKAALLEGGIIWRLAWNCCDLETTAKGPDLPTESFTAHSSVHLISLGGQRFAETVLSQQDRYILVGVYRVLTENPKQNSASITSWWPTQETWKDSGYNTGYWSHAAEVWYRRRIQLIEDGKAEPLTSNEWRNTLRHSKSDAKDLLEYVELLFAAKI
ncbi:hypothetical protein BDY19DRAFT_895211 [Irpex rosettiformis]|uniref:Uncharacterized protein n=1 Tax=Irpex rosettiformis TaxID=378272 RepID=A0ACB8TWR3_9APHY|nr:hypothetical protein BDY19DRAFT_895211 [Irpex rosettiformis]